MKIHSLLFIATASLAYAQVYQPSSNGGGSPQNSFMPNRGNNNSQQGNSIFGNDFPMLDAATETITIGGVTLPITDNRILMARFERFLSQPEENGLEARKYWININRILDTISPFAESGPNLQKAFSILPEASTYPADAQISSTLAELIYTALLAKKDNRQVAQLNRAMEKEKNTIVTRADWDARNDRSVKVTSQPVTNKGAQKTASSHEGAGVSSLKYKETVLRIAEIKALQKTNRAKVLGKVTVQKAHYQATMVQWFAQRRFEHVIMAARFYNQIWKDGDSKLRIKEGSDVHKILGDSLGINPTITSLESLAAEAKRETGNYMSAFDVMLRRGDIHTATQRLMEAFYLGEHLNPLSTLSLEKKSQVGDYVRNLRELYGTMQARDFTRAKELITEMRKQARDFPYSKAYSAVVGYTLASDLAVQDAKMKLLNQENAAASARIQEAAEIWPTNPKLDEFRELVNNSTKFITAKNDFDRLLSEGNYREIARRQYEIAPTLQGDQERQDAFMQIMKNLREIETALGKASEFVKIGQNYGAWEQLAEIREKFPDDPKLGREMELLAPKVADFTLALDKARNFEARNPRQTGSALAWFLKARAIHPQSQQASAGVQRMLDIISPTS